MFYAIIICTTNIKKATRFITTINEYIEKIAVRFIVLKQVFYYLQLSVLKE
jgi:hypothetical protein